MYASHFGFHRQPFHSADACRAFFVSESIRKILPQLFHALRSDLGIAVLTGVPGSGKTTLLRHVQQQLSNEGRAIVCSGASLRTSIDLISVLSQASRRKAGTDDVSRDISHVISVFESRAEALGQIRRTAELWGPVLLLIDDAHLVPLSVLNELRAFTEEEWNGRDLVRCLVSAPISFEEHLARAEYAEFGRRIRCHSFLQPLKSSETIQFLKTQIELAGGRLSEVFTTSALEMISQAAGGIPRCLGLLADESLVVAMESGETRTTEKSVRTALGRLQHLHYNWNASPEADIADEPESQSDRSPEKVNHSATVVIRERDTFTFEPTHPPVSAGAKDRTQSPSLATLAPGVIEFGGPSAHSRPIVGPESTQNAAARSIEISSDATRESEICSDASTQEVSTGSRPETPATPLIQEALNPASSMEFGAAEKIVAAERGDSTTKPGEPTVAFEVGRRFHAESSSDSISVEDVDDCDIPDLINADRDLTLADAGCVSGEHHETGLFWIERTAGESGSGRTAEGDVLEGMKSITSGIDSPSEMDCEVHSQGIELTTDRLIASSLQGESSGFFDNDSSHVMDCSPVLDRYTWIALGREVPIGIESFFSSPKQQWFEDFEFIGDSQFEQLYASTARTARATSIDNIPVIEVSDTDLLDQLRRNADAIETGSFVALERDPDTLCNSAETHQLKLWHDGQLVFGKSPENESVCDLNDADPEESVAHSVNTAHVGSGGFFTLPLPIEKIDRDLRALKVADDNDVSPIVETLTGLRAEIRQFQKTGKTSDSHVSSDHESHGETSELLVANTAFGTESLISKAKRQIDERDALGESAVVTLQMVPGECDCRPSSDADSVLQAGTNPSSGGKFSRLFTHLLENRQRELSRTENGD